MMYFEDIMDLFKTLAKGQGFYGRLVEAIESMDEDTLDEFIAHMESMEFKNPVDVILYMEG